MSKFTGQFDLFDEIFMTSDKNKTRADLFNEFYEATGGVIYKSVKVPLYDGRDVRKYAKVCPYLKIKKDGKKIIYEYYKKEYKSVSALLKNNSFYSTVPIYFKNISDLSLYFDFVCASTSSSIDEEGKKHCHITIAERSEIDEYQHVLPLLCDEDMKDTRYEYILEKRRELIKEIAKIYLAENPNFAFEDPDTARLWYELHYGENKGGEK